ncbi:carboxypeptidase-like regulatory domain-containing protein [Methanocella arvoryzae]|nr:carboxypeptidase regulatory-like domain-containing protein [Methanocella arvoryzae]
MSVSHTQPYTIWGYVRDTNGNPVSAATVTIGSLRLSSRTNADGYYQVSGIGFATGTAYSASASKSGYGQANGQFTVNGGDTHVDFTLMAPVTTPGLIAAQAEPTATGTSIQASPAPARIPTQYSTPLPAGQPASTTPVIENINRVAPYQQTSATPTQAPPIITASTNATIKLGVDLNEESNLSTMMISPNNESLIDSGMNNSSSSAISSGKRQGIVDIAGDLINIILTLFW